MNDRAAVRVHWSFWAIGVVTLIWNLMGCINFVMQMDPDMVASMPETHHAIIASRPAWATGGFALGVFGGALGCILLLLRRSSAYYVFIASLIGVTVTMIHAIAIVNAASAFSAFEIVLMIVMPVAVAAFLIWYAKRVQRKGWMG